MSIINDALKKTQLNFKKPKRNAKKEAEPKEQPSQDITNVYEKMYKIREDQRSSSAKAQIVATKELPPEGPLLHFVKKVLKPLLIFISVVAFIWVGFYLLSRYEPAQDFFQSLKGTNNFSRSSARRPVPKKRKYKPGELILNGLSIIDGRRVALINDKIYEIGETIDGKKISSIGLNQVELRDDQKIITIKVR